jgi:DNA mismatch endonuclease, patch repair protein
MLIERASMLGPSTVGILELAAETGTSRSSLMRAVRREHTAPEILVRRRLHVEGLRFRLHDRSLPGSPDLVLRACSSVVFVHGCFWHGHDCAHGRVQAKTNAGYWSDKIAANRERDERKAQQLQALGWTVETVWECQSKDEAVLSQLIERLKLRRDRERRVSALSAS